MALILNLETSTTNCSVSLSNKGQLIAIKETNSASYSHSELLHQYIDEIVKDASIKLNDLDAIAISKGPGSYTGLRIGVSTSKGLCYALNKPLIAISTLESLAHQIKIDNGHIISMLDARRMEVYASIFDSKHNIVRPTKAEILSEHIYDEFLNTNKVYFLGNAVEKSKSIINHPNAIFMDGTFPSARELAYLSEKKFNLKVFENLAYFEPFYLKEFMGVKMKTK